MLEDDHELFEADLHLGNISAFSPLEIARDAERELLDFLRKNPTIKDDFGAKEAKLAYDMAKKAFNELENARDKKTQPLHKAWHDAVAEFKPTIESFKSNIAAIDKIMQSYLREKKRAAEALAAEAERVRLEKERLAREAIAALREKENAEPALQDAASEQATKAWSEYESAERECDSAKKATEVKIEGGFKNNMGLRAVKKIQVLDDAIVAIKEMGVTDDIKEAVLKSARFYKRMSGRLPAGVREIDAE